MVPNYCSLLMEDYGGMFVRGRVIIQTLPTSSKVIDKTRGL